MYTQVRKIGRAVVDRVQTRLATALPLLIQHNIKYRIYIAAIIYTAGRECVAWETKCACGEGGGRVKYLLMDASHLAFELLTLLLSERDPKGQVKEQDQNRIGQMLGKGLEGTARGGVWRRLPTSIMTIPSSTPLGTARRCTSI